MKVDNFIRHVWPQNATHPQKKAAIDVIENMSEDEFIKFIKDMAELYMRKPVIVKVDLTENEKFTLSFTDNESFRDISREIFRSIGNKFL